MIKNFSVIFFCLLLSACNKDSSNGCSTDCSLSLEPGTESTEAALPNSALTFESNIFFIGTDAIEQDKFDSAVEMIKKVVASEEFREKILNHTYNGVKTFVDNGGYTNSQVYQKILDASEKLFPVKNNAIDMEVELYYENSNVVGYTTTSSKRIWVNNKYFVPNAISGVASNLFHEWLHKIGFGHAVNYSLSRDYSVPYAVGRMIGTIGNSLN